MWLILDLLGVGGRFAACEKTDHMQKVNQNTVVKSPSSINQKNYEVKKILSEPISGNKSWLLKECLI